MCDLSPSNKEIEVVKQGLLGGAAPTVFRLLILMRTSPSGEERRTRGTQCPSLLSALRRSVCQPCHVRCSRAQLSPASTHLSLPPGNVAELRRSPPLRGSLEQLVRLSPAGVPFQDTKLAALITPEASLQRLVPLVGTWRCGSPCQACLIGSCLQALVLPV